MYGPANRLLRSTGIVLGLSCAAAGCQSVTQQKIAWSFPPLREEAEVEDRPAITVQNQSLPPLPTDYDRWLQAQNTQAGALSNENAPGLKNPVKPVTIPAPLDTALVRTSAVANPSAAQAHPKLPPSQPLQTGVTTSGVGFDTPKPPEYPPNLKETNASGGSSNMFASNVSKTAASMPVVSNPPIPEKAPTSTGVVALDPKATQQIVKKIVGATDDILRTGLQEDFVEEDSLPTATSNAFGMRDMRPKTQAGQAVAVRASSRMPGGSKPPTERPPLETLSADPDESKMPLPTASLAPPLVIPKAAICRAVEGRGRFRALPAHLRAPGSPVIVYWELDGLTRDPATRTAEFTAVVELLASDRDEILASVRETVRETGAAPAEGDFAALRWTIPTEIATGEYRMRISVTETASKRSATTQIDLPVGRGPVASRFVLP